MYLRPSQLSIPPQVGSGGGTPNPRKLIIASVRIAFPTFRLKMTISGAIIFGKICRLSVFEVGEPIARAASTYTFSFDDHYGASDYP